MRHHLPSSVEPCRAADRSYRLDQILYGAEYTDHTRAYASTWRNETMLYSPLVKSYIQHRHSQDERALPVLDCRLGITKTGRPTSQSSGDELVFGRDWSASVVNPGRSGTPRDEDETRDDGLPRKKRKMAPKFRDSKVVSLERVLDGL